MMDVMEKYKIFFQQFDKEIQEKFSEFFSTFKLYSYEKLNTTKAQDKSKLVSMYSVAFTYLIQNVSNDLSNMSEEELYQLVLSEKANYTHKRVLSRYYGFLKASGLYNFKNNLSIVSGVYAKTQNDFYTTEEWSSMVNVALDIDTILPKALNNVKAARCWLYLLLHLCVAWRKYDILTLPAMDNLLNIEKYTLKWFEENVFTLEDAGYIINNVKLYAEQYLMRKNEAKKYFNVPYSFYIPLAIAFIVTENWRRILNQDKLFGNFDGKTKMADYLGDSVQGFSSLKANRTLLSFVDAKASEIGANDIVRISSYMRSHKVNGYYFSDNTSVYLKSNYSDKELNEITIQLYNRGLFGWMYDSLLKIVSDENIKTQKQTTMDIINLKNNLSAKQMNEIAGILYSQNLTKENVLNEILKMSQDEIKLLFLQLQYGEKVSKQEGIFCIKPNECNEKATVNCYMCKYSIPSIHALFSIKDELYDIFSKTKEERYIYSYDRLRILNKMLKLYSVVKEAVDAFGEGYVNSIIPLQETKDKLVTTYKKLIKEEENEQYKGS